MNNLVVEKRSTKFRAENMREQEVFNDTWIDHFWGGVNFLSDARIHRSFWRHQPTEGVRSNMLEKKNRNQTEY